MSSYYRLLPKHSIFELEKTKIKSLVIELCSHGSEKAFDQLFGLYYSPLRSYVLLYVDIEEVADEIVSDVFYAVWRTRKNILYPDSFDGYLYRIAKTRAINYLKRSKVHTLDIHNTLLDLSANLSTSSPEDILISDETVEKINNAIEELPPKCKATFKLVKEDKFSYRETARILDISVKTVDAHMCTAIKKIKESISK